MYLCLIIPSLFAEQVKMHPRFSVDQGTNNAGKRKIRAVDHLSWSATGGSRKKMKLDSINGHCFPTEKLSHDHLDMMMAAVKLFIEYVLFSCASSLSFVHSPAIFCSGKQG